MENKTVDPSPWRKFKIPKTIEPIHKGKCPRCKRGKVVPDHGMVEWERKLGYRTFVCWSCGARTYQHFLKGFK